MEVRKQEGQLVISEVIEHLSKILKEDGDLPVRFTNSYEQDEDYGDSQPVVGFTILLEEDETPDYVLVCDRNTLDAFL